jgi:Rrf2 family transcriptional regulator, iron-sulfur cluster assembly transcription factor
MSETPSFIENIFTVWLRTMVFSKSLSYAIRGVLYIATMQDTRRFIQAEDIAHQLAVPRHFMSKILKKLAKEKIIASVKGPTGGFTVTEQTLDTSILQLFEKIEGLGSFKSCVLRLQECSEDHPCAMHHVMKEMRADLLSSLTNTTIRELMLHEQSQLIVNLPDAGSKNPVANAFNI